FPIDRAYRFVLPLERDGARADIRTTRDQDRPAERAGWFTVPLDGRGYRLSATHFLEPGAGEIEVYFSDATSGRESYRMRYVPAEREGDRGFSTSTAPTTPPAPGRPSTTARFHRRRTVCM